MTIALICLLALTIKTETEPQRFTVVPDEKELTRRSQEYK
jgi:hypothetical protein